MLNKRLLTIEDLVNFCKTQNFTKFNSNEVGYKLCVQMQPHCFGKVDSRSDDFMLYLPAMLYHTGRNRNGSNVTKEAAEKTLNRIQNKPLLANFCEIDGIKDFTSHDMYIDENGKTVYLERQIGNFTSDEARLEYNEEKDRYEVYATVAIPKEYTDAAEIIERKDGTKISVEIFVNQMSYDAQNNELILEDIEIMGATCLGKNPDTGKEINEGMEGARLSLKDFSAETNSISYTRDEQLFQFIQELKTTFDNFIKESKNEGGVKMPDLELKNDDINMSDNTDDINKMNEEEPEIVKDEEGSVEPENPDEGDDNAPSDGDESAEFSIKHSVNGKTFEVSLNDIQYALETLVNETYGDQDATYYATIVYEKSVVMVDYWTDRAYRQTYKCKNGTYSLTGDRVVVKSCWLTEDEEKALDDMRSKYSEIETKLARYEEEPKKAELLSSDDYKQIRDVEEFVELSKPENHFEMSLQELENKANEILLNFAKSGKLSFAQKDSNSSAKKFANIGSKHESRYGDLFSNQK